MQIPDTPVDEAKRIATLRALCILDTLPEERFDRLTRLAKRLFDVPIALVSLVDNDRQWFKSRVGLDVAETSRDISFCGHAILGDDILMIPDTLRDDRFFDNPLVTAGPHIRFYAGCPLRAPDGSKLGTLCLIDSKPRTMDDEEHAVLHDLAHMAEQELAAAQLATMDELTMLSNRRGFAALAQHALDYSKRAGTPATLLFFDLNDFKQVNDTYGHAEGDVALRAFAGLLRTALRDSDIIARLGGDEFVALLMTSSKEASTAAVERLRTLVRAHNAEGTRGYGLHYSVGHVDFDAAAHASIAMLLAEADAAMYKHKGTTRAAV